MVDIVIFDHEDTILCLLEDLVKDMHMTVATLHLRNVASKYVCRLIEEERPSLVVYDLGPPPYEAALKRWAEVCREPGCSHVRYLITTTANPETLKSFDPSPCKATVAFLHRPFDTREFTSAVARTMMAP